MVKRKEERKRGKKRKPEKEFGAQQRDEEPGFVIDRVGDTAASLPTTSTLPSTSTGGAPAWMLDRFGPSNETSAPFGLVEPDLKAYLRTAHVTLQAQIQSALEAEAVLQNDVETKRLRNAILDESSGKELTLATDGDCSLILEDLMATLGDRQARILADALSHDWFTLVRHRFGSHVVQSLLVALQYFAMQSREEEQAQTKQGGGTLPTCAQLIVDMATALQAKVAEVVADQFGSHVVRSLLTVLAGKQLDMDDNRSKRSKSFQKKAQLIEARPWSKPFPVHQPTAFKEALGSLLDALHATLTDADRVRALCVDRHVSPTLSMVVTLQPTSGLLDLCLDGVASMESNAERSAHVETLLRDTVGSHFLESILSAVPEPTTTAFWRHYLQSRLVKLSTHPTANFVISALIGRLTTEQLVQACQEVAGDGDKMIEAHHLGPLTALCQRAAQLLDQEIKPTASEPPVDLRKVRRKEVWSQNDIASQVVRAILAAFGLDKDKIQSDASSVVPILLSGKTAKDHRRAIKQAQGEAKAAKKRKREAKAAKAEATEQDQSEEVDQEDADETATNGKTPDLITLQGSLLCQSILRLPDPAHTPLLEGLMFMPTDQFLKVARHPIGVHVPLALVQSTRLPFAHRSRFSNHLLTMLMHLVTDRFGSRLIDALFDGADAFFKEKMVRQCLAQERTLLADPYGRFFLKRIQLALFRRDLDKWKQAMRSYQQKDTSKDQNINGADDRQVLQQQPAAKRDASDDHTGQTKKKHKADKQPSAKRSKVDRELDQILAEVK